MNEENDMGAPPENQPPSQPADNNVQPPPLPGASGGKLSIPGKNTKKKTKLRKPAPAGGGDASGGKNKTVLIAVLVVVVLAVAGTLAFNAFYPSSTTRGAVKKGGPVLQGPAARKAASGRNNAAKQNVTANATKAKGRPVGAIKNTGRTGQPVSAQQAKNAAAQSGKKDAATLTQKKQAQAAKKATAPKVAARPAATKPAASKTSIKAAPKPARKHIQKKQASAVKQFDNTGNTANQEKASGGITDQHRKITITKKGNHKSHSLYEYKSLPQSNSLIDVSDITAKKYNASDVLFDWPGGKSAGVSKSLLDDTPEMEKSKRSMAEEEFNLSKRFYMVLVKESKTVEPLRKLAGKLKVMTLSPEIKKTVSHGQSIYWLTVGHYTNKNTAANKAREITSMGYKTTIVSEVIHY